MLYCQSLRKSDWMKLARTAGVAQLVPATGQKPTKSPPGCVKGDANETFEGEKEMALVCHVGHVCHRHVQRIGHTSGAKPVPGRAGACELKVVGLDNDVEFRSSGYLRLSCT